MKRCESVVVEWKTLSEDPLILICAYCDLNDVMSLRCTSSFFRKAAKKELKFRTVLHFSTFVGRAPNGTSRDYDDNVVSQVWKKDMQEECVNAILDDISKEETRCQHMDFSNLSCIHQSKLSQSLIRGLFVLDLSNCKSMDLQVLVSLPTASKFPLRELYLTGCRQLQGSHISSMTSFFPKLRVLHLSGCSQTIDDSAIIRICNQSKELVSLDLMGLNRITDIGMNVLFRRLNLKHLNINYCEKIELGFLSAQCNALKRLIERSSAEEIISICNDAVTNNSSDVLQRNLGMSNPYQINNLEVVDMSFGTSVRGGARAYSLSNFALASRGRLREVNISSSTGIVDDDIKILLMTCTNSLKSLEVRCCDNIRDPALEYIAQYGKHLAFLDFSACFNVTDEGVAQLQNCSMLTSLKMSSIHSLTDRSIAQLCELRKLVFLDLRSCVNVTTSAVRNVLQKCPLLVEIDARNIGSSLHAITSEDKRNLSIFNGRRCNTASTANTAGTLRCCSAIFSSQRTSLHQGVTAKRMYHCTQCNLLPQYNRGVCLICSEKCHKNKGHAGVYLGAITYFFCDCAFGFQPDGHCTALRR